MKPRHLLQLWGATLAAVSAAQANILSLSLGEIFGNNPVAPSPTGPWLVATIEDSVNSSVVFNSNTVRMTLDATNLGINVGNQNKFISAWHVNLNPAFNPSNFSFTSVLNPTGAALDIDKGLNAYKADGDGFFDFRFNFPTGNSMNRFVPGEKLIVDITYTGTLLASDFRYLSVDNQGNSYSGPTGPFYMAAHVQGTNTGPGQTTSAWIGTKDQGIIAIPEPSASATLIGVAAAMSVALIRRRRTVSI